MSAKIVAFANQKGGVGKTTSCVNLAAALSCLHKNVLLVDLDPQGNATMGSGINKHAIEFGINDLLLNKSVIVENTILEAPGGFKVLGANSDLTQAEVGLLKFTKKETILKNILSKVINNFDFIFLDCPPSLNMLTINSLVAADSIIIPMQCEYYALEGLSALLRTMETIKQKLNPDLKIEGVLRTMFDARNKLSVDVSDQLIKHFKNKLYKTIIPRNIRLAEAPSQGLPIILYDKHSKGSESYLQLAREFLSFNKIKTAAKRSVRQTEESMI